MNLAKIKDTLDFKELLRQESIQKLTSSPINYHQPHPNQITTLNQPKKSQTRNTMNDFKKILELQKGMTTPFFNNVSGDHSKIEKIRQDDGAA